MLGCVTPADRIYLQTDQEKFKTEGVSIFLKETSRTQVCNDEVVKYRVLTRGLPTDKRYTLYYFQGDSRCKTVFERYQVNKSGDLFSYDNQHSYHEIIITLHKKYLGVKRIKIVLLSTDEIIRTYTEFIPFVLACN